MTNSTTTARPGRRSLLWLLLAFAPALGLACAGMPGGFGLGGILPVSAEQHSQQRASRTSEHRVEVNGEEVEYDYEEDDLEPEEEEEEERPARRRRRRRSSRRKKSGGVDRSELLQFGNTCNKNRECESRACFVGRGSIGYCTRICDGFQDCPFKWECKRPGNAPQKICQQRN